MVCKDCKNRLRREYTARFPERVKMSDLKYHYGLTLDEYRAMVERQGGRCAICGQADVKLVVDHNHVSGAVRSLLCHLCNAMIGCARERIDILAAAAAYLYAETHPEAAPVQAQVAFMVAAVASE